MKQVDQLDLFSLLNKDFKEEPEGELVELKVVSCKDFENLKITHKQIRVLINALKVFEYCVEDSKLHQLDKEFRINESEEIVRYFSSLIKYDYDKAVNECINKQANKYGNRKEDIGMETMSWLAESK